MEIDYVLVGRGFDGLINGRNRVSQVQSRSY
jgi:hypothetical protein